MSSPNGDLASSVQSFAQQLMDTLTGVLGREVLFEVKVGPAGPSQHITIEQADSGGISFEVDQHPYFRLLVRYRCSWNRERNFFAVETSSFTVRVEDVNEPIFHFDYKWDSVESVPVAHINVHAHRDELVWAMLMARTGRGKERWKAAQADSITRVSALHFPVGGHRFRPALEDLLEMLIREFGVDHAPGAIEVIRGGRRRFRSIQVSAAVADDPDAAAEALTALGYTVVAPAPRSSARPSRLSRY